MVLNINGYTTAYFEKDITLARNRVGIVIQNSIVYTKYEQRHLHGLLSRINVLFIM